MTATFPSTAPDKRQRGRPRKTALEKDDGNRRRQLLQGAARLFRRKGFDATTTRDIAAAAGMHSGSPFYHFKSKADLLYAVMEEGMQTALLRQSVALQAAGGSGSLSARSRMRVLVRTHFDVLLGAGNDFVPVMLYEARSLNARQRSALADLRSAYESAWLPVLDALHADGQLRAPVKLARLMILGALNWSVQWFDRKKGASLDVLTESAMALFLPDPDSAA